MKLKSVLLALPVAVLLAGPVALAQTTTKDTKAPEAGANSFTEAQAKDRIEKAGFSQVAGLKKDAQGSGARPPPRAAPRSTSRSTSAATSQPSKDAHDGTYSFKAL